MGRVIEEELADVDHPIDVIDQAFAPRTGRPEAGLLPARGLAIFRWLSSIDFVSRDVVEVYPGYDPVGDRDALPLGSRTRW